MLVNYQIVGYSYLGITSGLPVIQEESAASGQHCVAVTLWDTAEQGFPGAKTAATYTDTCVDGILLRQVNRTEPKLTRPRVESQKLHSRNVRRAAGC